MTASDTSAVHNSVRQSADRQFSVLHRKAAVYALVVVVLALVIAIALHVVIVSIAALVLPLFLGAVGVGTIWRASKQTATQIGYEEMAPQVAVEQREPEHSNEHTFTVYGNVKNNEPSEHILQLGVGTFSATIGILSRRLGGGGPGKVRLMLLDGDNVIARDFQATAATVRTEINHTGKYKLVIACVGALGMDYMLSYKYLTNVNN